jgi:endogenous inhibitor of DNA gyrase (YacG/DUF329 family)
MDFARTDNGRFAGRGLVSSNCAHCGNAFGHYASSAARYCSNHCRAVGQWRDPEARARMQRGMRLAHGDIRSRLLSNSEQVSETGCMIWLGALNNGGYGSIRYEGKVWIAHRLAFEIFVGQIPPGALICHRCDVRACINPAHLFVGSARDNSSDMTAKGRQANGDRSGAAKLTAAQVIAIRSAYLDRTLSQGELSASYGVSRITISNIIHRQTWRHL